jgi:glycopeptide antibiotics resistance protein
MSLVIQYIWNMVPYCVLGAVLFIIFRVIFQKDNTLNLKKDIATGLFIAYCFGLASQTIIPHFNFGISSSTGKPFLDVFITNDNSSINLIPFKTIFEQIVGRNEVVSQIDIADVSILNLLSNIFLFSPIGFFVPLINERYISLKKIILIGVSTSCVVEVIQLFIGRSCDIDDVILNTCGVVIGFIIFKVYKRIVLSR